MKHLYNLYCYKEIINNKISLIFFLKMICKLLFFNTFNPRSFFKENAILPSQIILLNAFYIKKYLILIDMLRYLQNIRSALL